MGSRAHYHGLLVVDKPGGMTSRDVVNLAQGWFPRGTRLGHTGTLDPLATGVLVLCVGVATRLTEYVQELDKTYLAGLRLGARSDTDDADGTITESAFQPPDDGAVRECLRGLVGEIEQVPPAYSAAKVTGRRAYDLARSGEQVRLGPRRVHVYGIDVIGYAFPRLDLTVRCGKGTYIRSLARDLGERLGCGALVETLRRTRVGTFRAEDALLPEADSRSARERLLPLASAVAELPRMELHSDLVHRLRQGQSVRLRNATPRTETGATVAIFDRGGTLVGVAEIERTGQFLRPKKMLLD
jgi:tRNA pseudouridine55 synthase